MRPTASDGDKLSAFAITNPSNGFTRYWPKYPMKMGAGLSAHFLKSLTVRVSPIVNIRKPKAYVNNVDENHVTAEGLAMPIAAPKNTHNGKRVARRSASFSIPDGSVGISADDARDSTCRSNLRLGRIGKHCSEPDTLRAHIVRFPTASRDLLATERPCAREETDSILNGQQRALETCLLCYQQTSKSHTSINPVLCIFCCVVVTQLRQAALR
jgi:hypothetical protein